MGGGPVMVTNDFAQKCVTRCVRVFAGAPVQGVESPLEDAFLKCWCIVDAMAVAVGGQSPREIHRQVDTGTGHRVDFEVVGGSPYRLAVELDGHEWHEKTKEQVARRNERDRILLGAGWRVIRFSGPEFYADPLDCILQVRRIAKMQREVAHA